MPKAGNEEKEKSGTSDEISAGLGGLDEFKFQREELASVCVEVLWYSLVWNDQIWLWRKEEERARETQPVVRRPRRGRAKRSSPQDSR